MKYNEPSEFFRNIIEKADINIINDEQKCLALVPYLLDNEKSYYKLLKIAFIFNVYKELLEANNKGSDEKTLCIKKAVKILTDECFIKDEKAVWAVGWLASVVYPIEWKCFLNHPNQEIDKNQSESKSEITIEAESNSDNNNIIDNKNWTLDPINLEMIYCPAGSFMMGSSAPTFQRGLFGFIGKADEGELGRYDNEILHQVILSKSFYIGKYPITQKQYKTIIGENPSSFKGDNNPVEGVNWYDSKKFCERLNSEYADNIPQGFKFALPTEAQWEYACRAETTTALNNGKDLTTTDGICHNLDEVAWYYKNSDGSTHPVGLKKPNNWGIYDMHGNVWEWCEDWYEEYSKDKVTDPKGPNSGTRRIFRGGGWFFNPLFCRSAFRRFSYPDNRGNIVGFRVALVPIK